MMSRAMRARAGWVTLMMAGLLLCPAAAMAEKTVLRLRLDGPVMEAPSDANGLMAILASEQFTTLHEWVTDVRRAAQDENIDGLVLIIEQPQANLAQLEEMSAALREFHAHGKPVYCYIDYASNLTYALAAACDHITIAENSEVVIVGLQADLVFYKGLLDKIGVEFDVLRAGAYKSAVEPFTRTEPSAEYAEMMNWLLDSLFERWIGLIAEGRDLSPAEVKRLVDQAPIGAAEAKESKLVDAVGTFASFKQMIYKEFGRDVRVLKEYDQGAADEIDMQNPFAVFGLFMKMVEGVTPSSDPGLGLVYVDGTIMVGENDDSPLGGSTAGSTTLRAALDKACDDEKIRAVVLRVDSPGGSVVASDIIWNAATRCAKKKPLIVSMGGVAGSGGYYVAVPGDVIFADATTITGSIGVLGGKPVWKELMEEKLGITTTSFTRGKHAGIMSLDRKWSESEREWLRGYIDEIYELFKGRVLTTRREHIKGDLEDLAGGRVYTGEQALELGLIDRLGGLTDAMAVARERADLAADCPVYVLPKPSELAAMMNMLEQLVGDGGEDEFEVALRPLGRNSLIRAALPLLRQLAPRKIAQIMEGLQNLAIMSQERVGCFMTTVPRVH